MAARHGGARRGSGRKRTRDIFDAPIRRAEQRIADRLPDLIDNLLVLADGVTVQETDKDDGVHVYTRPPDRAANEYLINRVMGKPTELVEQDVTERGSVTIRTITAVQPQLPAPSADADR